jgi:hypothetical protein
MILVQSIYLFFSIFYKNNIEKKILFIIMSKDYNVVYSKDLVSLEKEIEMLDNIPEWTTKIKKMKELKEKITTHRNKLNSFIDIINSGEVKKNKKKKDLSLDELLEQFSETDDIEEKVKLFNHIQYIIKESEMELFEE